MRSMDVGYSKQRYLSVAFALLFPAGLFMSLLITFGAFGPDADVSQAAMLWHGIDQFGLSFLHDWRFTADNWLFSLYPITFGLFALFGPEPQLPILTGWLIFVASVLLTGLMAKVLDAPKSAVVVPLMLVFSGLYAHHAGFLAYPASHNVTNLYGLAAFLCLLGWIKARNAFLPPLVVLSLIAGGLSDPWIVAAYALPLTLTTLLLVFLSRNPDERRASLLLSAALILSLLVIETRAFGTLGFLTPFHFSAGGREQMVANAVGLVRALGGLLNIVPGASSDQPVPALVSAFVVGALIVGVTRLIPIQSLRDTPLPVAFCCTIALSLGGMAIALVISEIPVAANSARFLVNALYLAPIGIAVLLELNRDRASRALRLALMLAAAMFATAGIVSSFPVWRSPSIAVRDLGTRDLLKFLSDNNLNYGYGAYWGSQANAATWLSHFKIRIRPVVFDQTTGTMRTGNRAQTSRLWYLPSDMPPDQTRFFVVIKDDGEECPDVRLCVDGVVSQFGPPERRLQYKNTTVLVWPRLLPQSPLYLNHSIGDRIGASELGTSHGWSAPAGGSAWSDGEAATVLLKLAAAPERDLELLIEGHAFVNARSPRQEIEVSINGHVLATLNYDSPSVVTRSVTLPRSLGAENEGRLMIQFGFRNAASPAELGLSGDVRRLGLAIVSLQLRAAAL